MESISPAVRAEPIPRPAPTKRAALLLSAWLLAGCAEHRIFTRQGLDPATAERDWSQCQAEAMAAAGIHPDPAALSGLASVSSDRLSGALVPVRRDDAVMVSPADYRRIKIREAALQACMSVRGYRYLGQPATERF